MIFHQELLDTNKFKRTFSPQIDSSELVWHRDHKDREITIIKGTGWKYQEDNELPIDLTEGLTFSIPKEKYHRVIKGDDELVIIIKEM